MMETFHETIFRVEAKGHEHHVIDRGQEPNILHQLLGFITELSEKNLVPTKGNLNEIQLEVVSIETGNTDLEKAPEAVNFSIKACFSPKVPKDELVQRIESLIIQAGIKKFEIKEASKQ
jgi:hypothetical protein